MSTASTLRSPSSWRLLPGLFCLVMLCALQVGCGGGGSSDPAKTIQGTWKIDGSALTAEISKNQAEIDKNPLGKMMVGMLTSMVDNMKITFTADKMSMAMTQDGKEQKQEVAYTIVKKEGKTLHVSVKKDGKEKKGVIVVESADRLSMQQEGEPVGMPLIRVK